MNWETIKLYAQGIDGIGGPENIWGFVDGTLRSICRPEEEQHQFYTGYKRCHAIKFQGITAPDGLIVSLAGPFERKLGDWMTWRQSGVEEILRDIFSENREQGRLFLYGDHAYSLSFGIICPFKDTISHQITPEEKAFNAKMSGYRIAIEHSFGKVVNLWSFIAFKNGLQIGLSPVGAYYAIAVLLTNLHTCLYGSQISLHFKVMPPSVDSYLNLEF